MNNKKPLLNNPYGHADYETFHAKRRAIADKSGFIRFIDDESMTSYPVLLHPGRFGKSTFMRMLKCFYDISYRDRYDEIFSGTDIYKENPESRNSYHVLSFNFSGVSGDDKERLISSFVIAIDLGLEDFRERYPDFDFNPSEKEKDTPSGFIKSFFKAYKRYQALKYRSATESRERRLRPMQWSFPALSAYTAESKAKPEAQRRAKDIRISLEQVSDLLPSGNPRLICSVRFPQHNSGMPNCFVPAIVRIPRSLTKKATP